MIVRGFLKNTSTKIYLFIITTLLLGITMLFVATNYLTQVNNEEYHKISLFYIESKNNYYDELIKGKYFINIHEVLKFEYFDNLIDYKDITEFELGNMALVYADEDNKYNLSDEEIVIVFEHNIYNNNSPYFNKYLNQNLAFIFNDSNIDLKIKKIEKDYRGKVIIPQSLFNKLKDKYENHIYTANFITEDKEDKFYATHEISEEYMYLNLDIEQEQNLEYREKMKNNLKIMQYASYICIGIFILVIVVVNKNIISDIKNNMLLEKRIGYSDLQIKLNIMKRLVVLHILSYIISTIIALAPIVFINIFWKMNIKLTLMTNNLILILLFLLSDLLLSLVVNNKSNSGERRKIR